ncbi:hypothetical protein J437_LFUL013329 [Ladona fulva]|uniref:C2H2-type domain-containing protein n=1 Tax=Ladona fulva TaxID=123851 RepID=A0A8K0KI46_LADFU|nr:hypothetical protein J437_LFUL013329 [Ladona fulva]
MNLRATMPYNLHEATGLDWGVIGNADCAGGTSVPTDQYENDFGTELSPQSGYQQNLQENADCSGGTSVPMNQHENDVAAVISWQTGHQQNLQGNADCTVVTSVLTDQYENDFGAEISSQTRYQQNLQSCCRVSVLKEVSAISTPAVDHDGSKNSRKRKIDDREDNAKIGTQVCEDSCSIEEDNAADNNNADACIEEAVPSTSQDDGPNCKRSKLSIGGGSVETQRKADSEDITSAQVNQAKDNNATPARDDSEESQDVERGTEEEEDSPVECDRCLERFWMKYSQKKHLRVHVIKRPYQCDVCWKRFAKEHILKAHRVTSNKETKEMALEEWNC